MSIRVSPKLAVLVALAIFVIPAVAGDTPSDLVGHWTLIEQPYNLTIEFKENGVYIALTKRGVRIGRWEQLDESRLSTWNNSSLPKRVSKFSVAGDILTITDDSGTTLKHRRILLHEL